MWSLPCKLFPHHRARQGALQPRRAHHLFDVRYADPPRFLSGENGSGSTLVPGLATSWNWVDDRPLDVTLRDGVKFHNGETLTADYVVFIFSPERLTGETAPLPMAARISVALNR